MKELTSHSVHDGVEWYNIPDVHCTHYSISECGRVYSNKRLTTRKWRNSGTTLHLKSTQNLVILP